MVNETVQIDQSKRNFLINTASLATVAAGVGLSGIAYSPDLARQAGHLVDILNPPEKIGFLTQTNLLPRKNNEPTIDAPTISKSLQELPAELVENNQVFFVRLPQEAAQYQGQFSREYITAGEYLFAGAAVVTTREGLIKGAQEFAAIFTSGKQIIAVGYETNRLFILDKVNKEWEDVVLHQTAHSPTESNNYLAVAQLTNIWPVLEKSRYCTTVQGLWELIEFGNQVQVKVGYKPFAGVFSHTRMPLNKKINLTEIDFAQDLEQALGKKGKYPHRYYVTEQGALLDLVHVAHKARQAAQWEIQLSYYDAYQNQTNSVTPKLLETGYYFGATEDSSFRYRIDSEVTHLSHESLLLQLMADFTYRSEGVIQMGVKFLIDKVDRISPIDLANYDVSGYSPEDAYSNTIAAFLTNKVLANRQLSFRQIIDTKVAEAVKPNKLLSPRELLTLTEKILNSEEFGFNYLNAIINELYNVSPCKKFNSELGELALGFYPFIPTLVEKIQPNQVIDFPVPSSNQGVHIEKAPNMAVNFQDTSLEINKASHKLFDNLKLVIKKILHGI